MWLLLARLSLFGDIVVSGTSTCPSPHMVSSALAESLEEGSVTGALRVDAGANGTFLSYTDEAGGVRTRVLPQESSCEDQAARVLVVVASWLSAPPGLALPPEPLAASELVVATPAPEHTWRLGLAPLLAWDTQGFSAGGRMEVTWQSSARRLAWRTQLLGGAPRAVDVATWMYAALGVSASGVAWKTKAMEWTLDAGPLASLVTARGRSLDEPARDWKLGIGANVGSRVTIPLGAFEPFIDLRGLAWLQAPTVRAMSRTGDVLEPLPRTMVQLSLGCTLSL